MNQQLAAPITGTCRLQDGTLTIIVGKTTRRYRVERMIHADAVRLHQEGTKVTYDVHIEERTCDCADFTYRDRRDGQCKHLKSVLACRKTGRI